MNTVIILFDTYDGYFIHDFEGSACNTACMNNQCT